MRIDWPVAAFWFGYLILCAVFWVVMVHVAIWMAS